MWRALIFAGSLVWLALGTPSSAPATSLDTGGTNPCSIALVGAGFEPNPVFIYHFEGTCNGPMGMPLTVKARTKWFSALKRAEEAINVEGSGAGGIVTKMTCGDDPFVTSASCTLTSIANSTMYADITPGSSGYPFLRGIATAAQAQALRAQSVDQAGAPQPPAPYNFTPTVVKPGSQQVFPVGSPVQFQILPLDPKWGYPVRRIDLEWRFYDQGKGSWATRSITNFQPPSADNEAMLVDGLNLSASIFQEGTWAVRVRLAHGNYPWGQWRWFHVGKAQVFAKMAQKLDGIGDSSSPQFKKTPDGTMVMTPRSGDGLAGRPRLGQPDGTGVSDGSATGPAKAVTLSLAKPNLVLGQINYKPAPPKAGTPVVVAVEVANKGLAKSGDGFQLAVRCKASAGGQCPVADLKKALPSIEPGQSHWATVAGSKPATAGKYELEIHVEPVVRGTGRVLELTVAPTLIRPVGQLAPGAIVK